MIALIVGTHGMFSKELVKSAEMIFGEQKNICLLYTSDAADEVQLV